MCRPLNLDEGEATLSVVTPALRRRVRSAGPTGSADLFCSAISTLNGSFVKSQLRNLANYFQSGLSATCFPPVEVQVSVSSRTISEHAIPVARSSNIPQHNLMLAQPLVAVRRNQIVMLNPYPADAGDVQARFERHYVAG